jgi:hypothetical protein
LELPLAIARHFQLHFSQTEKVNAPRPKTIPVIVMTFVQPNVAPPAQKLVALAFQQTVDPDLHLFQ